MFTRAAPIRTRLALLTAAAILAACATSQENPQYQYSTKFKGDAPNSAYASNTARTYQETREPVFVPSPEVQSAGYVSTTYSGAAAPSYTQVSADCINQGAQGTLGCAPTPLPINAQSASVAQPFYGNPETLYVTSTTTTSVSPTEEAMPDSYGTPGYEAMKNAESGWSYEDSQTPEWEAVASPQSSTAPQAAVPMTQPFASPVPPPASRGASIQPVRSQPIAPLSQNSFALGTQYEVQEGDTVYAFARKLCTSIEDIRAMNSLDGNFSIKLGQNIRLPASKC